MDSEGITGPGWDDILNARYEWRRMFFGGFDVVRLGDVGEGLGGGGQGCLVFWVLGGGWW